MIRPRDIVRMCVCGFNACLVLGGLRKIQFNISLIKDVRLKVFKLSFKNGHIRVRINSESSINVELPRGSVIMTEHDPIL